MRFVNSHFTFVASQWRGLTLCEFASTPFACSQTSFGIVIVGTKRELATSGRNMEFRPSDRTQDLVHIRPCCCRRGSRILVRGASGGLTLKGGT